MLQISKTSQSIVGPGATLIYTITYESVGSGPATGVVVTETVPDVVTFDADDSTPGWSCPNGSPPGTMCTIAVPDVPPSGMGTLLFAVIVDKHPGQARILNNVTVKDSQGGSSGGGSSTVIGEPAPAPAMTLAGLAAALAMLSAVAAWRLRAARGKAPPR
ncbi:MAG: hypothetical protein ABI629_14505 [bacterium]